MQHTVTKLASLALLVLCFLIATGSRSLNLSGSDALAVTLQETSTAKSWEKSQVIHSLKPFGEPPSEPTCTGWSITSQAFSPDSQTLALGVHSFVDRRCGGGNSKLMLWNLQTGRPIKTLIEGYAAEALLASDPYRQQEPDPATIVGDIAHALAFTADGQTLAAAMSDKTIKVWNGKTGQLIRTLQGHRYAVRAIAISSDGQTLISGSSDQTIKLWNLKTGQLIRTLKESQPVYQLLISPDAQSLASVTAPVSYDPSYTVKLWNLKTGQVIRTFSDFADFSPYPLLSPDGQTLVTASNDNSIRLWNARTGVRMRSLISHSAPIRRLAISPDGQFLASSSADGSVKLWNFKTGQIIRTIPNLGDIYRLVFSADGRTLAMHDGRGIQLWNWRLPQKIRTIEGSPHFTFAPNGQTLLAAHNYRLEVWR
jgi:WD40 repeat protein